MPNYDPFQPVSTALITRLCANTSACLPVVLLSVAFEDPEQIPRSHKALKRFSDSQIMEAFRELSKTDLFEVLTLEINEGRPVSFTAKLDDRYMSGGAR